MFGQSILAVRGLSVVLSVALVLAIVSLARMFFNPRIAHVGGLLFAVSPFQIHYGQEARMYILLALCLIMATLMIYQGLSRNSRFRFFFFSLFCALAMYSHVLAVFYLIPLVIMMLTIFRSRSSVLKVLFWSLVAILFYSPWLIQLPGQVLKVQQAYWIERPGIASLVQTALGFITDLPVKDDQIPFLLGISLVILVFSTWESVFHIRHHGETRNVGLITLGLTWMPVLLLFLVSQLRPLFILRGLLPSGVLYIMLIGWIVVKGRPLARWTLVVGLMIGFSMGMYNHFTYAGFPYAPFTALNNYLSGVIEPRDVVLHSNKLTMLPAFYDDPSLPHHYLQDPPASGGDTLALPTQEVLRLWAESDALEAAHSADRVYFVIFEREFEDYARLGFQSHPALDRLSEMYVKTRQMQWEDLWLYTYELQG